MSYKVKAYIHSTDCMGEATIISHTDNNNVIAEVNGVRCTAIFNCFRGFYYVDDVYGILKNQPEPSKATEQPDTPKPKRRGPQR